MNNSLIPTPDEAASEVDAALLAIYEALDDGTARTRAFFENREEPVDPNLGPSLVRYFGKRYLDSQGHEVRDDADTEDYDREDIGNNGLLVRVADYTIRVLKEDNGAVPSPGASKARLAFYNQQLAMPLWSNGNGPLRFKPNLVVIWSVDRAYLLDSVTLVCPRSAEPGRRGVRVHWAIEVKHPAYRLRSAEPPQTDDDLPLSLDDDPQFDQQTG